MPWQHLLWVFGVETKEEAFKRLEGFKLDGVIQKMRCPYLLVYGEGDQQAPFEHAQKMIAACGSERKTLKVFTREEGGYHHCQVDNVSIGVAYMWDWIADVLNPERLGRSLSPRPREGRDRSVHVGSGGSVAMTPALEIAANAITTVSIVLAGRNSIHTWWTGILGCLLFIAVFYFSQLYADVVLQVFFIATSVLGWRLWLRGDHGRPIAVGRASPALMAWTVCVGAAITLAYGAVLHTYTDAYAPFVDSAVLGIQRRRAGAHDAATARMLALLARRRLHRRAALCKPRPALDGSSLRVLLDGCAGLLLALAAAHARSARGRRNRRVSGSYQRGLVIGKFCPLHRGHELLIEQAQAACDELLIISWSKPEFRGCEGESRERWLARLFPAAERLVLDDARLRGSPPQPGYPCVAFPPTMLRAESIVNSSVGSARHSSTGRSTQYSPVRRMATLWQAL